MFGGQRRELVLHGQVFGSRKVERDSQIAQRITKVDADVKRNGTPTVAAVAGDVRPHFVDGGQVEGRVEHLPAPFDVTARDDVERFFRNYGRFIAHEPAGDFVFT